MRKGITIFGFTIAWYGIIIAIGMVIAVIIAIYNAKKRGLKADDIFLLALYVIPIAVVGARLYYVAFAERTYSFWEIFKIWEGGLAIYGGVIGGAIGAALYCIIHKKNFLLVADVIMPSLILAQGIGRWGNFVNGEAYGYEVTDPAWQWFPFAVDIDGTWHLATFFYESYWDIMVFYVLMIVYSNVKKNGVTMCGYFIGYGIGRAIIEGLRTDSLYLWNTGIRVSQALSILLVIGGIIGLILIYTIKRKRGVGEELEKDDSIKTD